VNIFRQGPLEVFQQFGIETQLDNMFGGRFFGQFRIRDFIGMTAQAGRFVRLFQGCFQILQVIQGNGGAQGKIDQV
jgi:hypothetical protein